MADPAPATLAPVRVPVPTPVAVPVPGRRGNAPPGSPRPTSARHSPVVRRAGGTSTTARRAKPGKVVAAAAAGTVTETVSTLSRRNKHTLRSPSMPAWNTTSLPTPGYDGRMTSDGTSPQPSRPQSSRAQAARIRKEFADKTRHMHRMLYEEKKRLEQVSLIKKVVISPPPTGLPTAEEQVEAEEEFKRMMNDIAKQNSLVMAGYRKQAIKCEQLLAARGAARVWRGKAAGLKFLGPYTLPNKVDRLSKLCETGLADPRSAVAMFLLVCLRRSRSRKLGTQMLLKVMHPDCLTFSQTGDGSETKPAAPDLIRKHTYKNLHTFLPEVIASYVVGTTAKNGYAFDPDSIRYEIDVVNTSKVYNNEHGATCNVWVVSTGAPPLHPNSRMVELKNYQGKWHVRRFNKLTADVQRTFNQEVDGLIPNLKEEDYVTPINTSDTGLHRFREGGLGKARRKLAAEKYRLQEISRTKRTVHARVETQGLATMLVNRDLYDKYIDNPNQERVLVDAHGKVTEFDDAVISRLKADHEKVAAADVAARSYEHQHGDENFVDPDAPPAKPEPHEAMHDPATSTVDKLLAECVSAFARTSEVPEQAPAGPGSVTANDLAVEDSAGEQRGKAFPAPTA